MPGRGGREKLQSTETENETFFIDLYRTFNILVFRPEIEKLSQKITYFNDACLSWVLGGVGVGVPTRKSSREHATVRVLPETALQDHAVLKVH